MKKEAKLADALSVPIGSDEIAAMTAKTLPDVAQMGGAPTMADSGVIVPIGDLVSKQDLDDIYPGFWDYNKFGNQIVSMPYNNSIPILYYNKDLIPTPPTTWAEFYDLSKSLTVDIDGDGTIDRYGTALRPAANPEQFLTFLDQAGGSILNADWTAVTINNIEGMGAIQFCGSLIPYTFITSDYLSDHMGQVAMFIDTSAGYSYNRDAAANLQAPYTPYAIGVAMLPAGPVHQSSMIQGTNLAVFDVANQTQAQKDAAVLFARYLLRAENTVYWAMNSGYQPVTKSAYELQTWKDFVATHDYQQAMSAQMLLGFSQILHPNYGDMRTILSTKFDEIMRGVVTPLDGLNSMAEEITPLLSE